jgi:hypothetical protein
MSVTGRASPGPLDGWEMELPELAELMATAADSLRVPVDVDQTRR